MASVVAAAGTSHGPMLSISPAQWDCFTETDPFNQELYDASGMRHSYAELARSRGPALEPRLLTPRWSASYSRWQEEISELSGLITDVAPDFVVVIGNDQRETMFNDNQPAVLVHVGESLPNAAFESQEKAERRARSRVRALSEWAYSPAAAAEYPGAPDFAGHLVRILLGAGFDPAVTTTWPGNRSVGHAFGFVYERLLGQLAIPSVAIALNTFYPPNQPTAARCAELGTVLHDAIRQYDGGARVAVIASGGLSHHLVNEDLDATVVGALRRGDLDALAGLPSTALLGGSSEIRNWIAMAPSALGLSLRIDYYEACYRNAAGIGNGMGFFGWSA
jgi:3-O-methylgallate 3,4-dioxygenase